MLRITLREEGSTYLFVLEGKLAGPWVGELRKSWEASGRKPHRHAIVDLAAVTSIDSNGKALLAEMHRKGIQLVATGLMTQAIVEDIQNSKS